MADPQFTVDARARRKPLIRSFTDQLKAAMPSIRKGSGNYWTAQLNDYVYFYVSFDFPKYPTGDYTFAIYYGIQDAEIKPAYKESVRREKYVRFPYKVHHRMFEFRDALWYKEHTGYLYWKLLMQKKKVHYYTDEQANYASRALYPVAVKQIKKAYDSFYDEFNNTDSRLPAVQIG